jgi:tetratricopeptide (TPR) repeat protein
MESNGNVDQSLLIRLLEACVILAEKSTCMNAQRFLHLSLALFEWMRRHGHSLSSKQLSIPIYSDLYRARAHFEVYRSQNVACEEFHLHQARELYTKHFDINKSWRHVKDHIDYFRCLLYSGELRTAATVISEVISRFEHDPRLPDYQLYAGAVYKALHEHDKASNYFFEATQTGPPRFFSKIEMMTIISRNLEEMGMEGEEDSDNAYRMVRTIVLNIYNSP